MNMADMIIIGAVAAFGLLGLKWGILKPATGLGGLVLGVLVAINISGQVMPLLVGYIDSDRLREIVAFASVVLAVVVAVRVAGGLLKKLLTLLVLGWVDHVAGAAAGVILGMVLTGTAVYLLTGADLGQTREALAASRLAPEVSRVSLVTSSSPWCSSLPEASEKCTDVLGVIAQLWGHHVSPKFDGLLGEDGALKGVVDLSEVSGVIEGAFADKTAASAQPANED